VKGENGKPWGLLLSTGQRYCITPAVNDAIFDRFLSQVIPGRSPVVRAAPALDSSIVAAIGGAPSRQISVASQRLVPEVSSSVKSPSLAEAQE